MIWGILYLIGAVITVSIIGIYDYVKKYHSKLSDKEFVQGLLSAFFLWPLMWPFFIFEGSKFLTKKLIERKRKVKK